VEDCNCGFVLVVDKMLIGKAHGRRPLMETRHGKIEGPLTVDRELAVHGTIVGHARVRPSGSLELHGVITGDLTVEPGGTAIIYGAVMGTIYKTGGTVVIAHPPGSGRDDPSNSANSSIDKA
jgi:hypothetical protein